MKILGLMRHEAGGSYYRVQQPLTELGRHGHTTSCGPARSDVVPDRDTDIVVGHMVGGFEQRGVVHDWWRRMAKRHRRVYELDDDPFEIEPTNPVYGFYGQSLSRDSLFHCIQTADLVTASTDVLAERMSKINRRVVVCRNRIDAAMLDLVRPRRDRLTIGWAGGASHSEDMTECAYGLRKTLQRNPDVDMHFIGVNYKNVIRHEARYTKWSIDLFDYYRSIDFDIGIAPLRSTVFAETKSYIKALEYAALGIPVVASDTAPYREFVIDGVTGFLVSKEHEWADRLRSLINDEALRTEMGAKAKQHARSYTIQTGWQDWESAYERIL